MTDRRTVAGGLLVLGAVLAVVGSFQDTYGFVFEGNGSDMSVTTSMWAATFGPAGEEPQPDTLYADGMPVLVVAVALVVAAVLTFRDRRGPLAPVAAGALAGIVFYYVTGVLHEQELRETWSGTGERFELTFHAGTYLLVAGTVAGLVGAVLAHEKKQPREEKAAVVVHQLEADDDTPPFGIEQQQEPQ